MCHNFLPTCGLWVPMAEPAETLYSIEGYIVPAEASVEDEWEQQVSEDDDDEAEPQAPALKRAKGTVARQRM